MPTQLFYLLGHVLSKFYVQFCVGSSSSNFIALFWWLAPIHIPWLLLLAGTHPDSMVVADFQFLY